MAFTHLASVVAIEAIALAASTRYVPGEWEPIMELFSGILVLGVGLWMLSRSRSSSRHPHPHHHHPSRVNEGPIETAGIVTLGISGGIVPCPAAIVILLVAISTGRLVEGLLVVLSFSIGLTAALIALGLLVRKAASAVVRWMGSESKAAEVLPKLSAGFIALLGLVMTVRFRLRTPIN